MHSGLLATGFALAIGGSLTSFAQQPRQDWPGWRGPAIDATAKTATSIFAKPFELRLRWTKVLGPGYSGVVISDGHAVTMFSDGKNDVLISLTADTGREEWRLPIAATFPGKDGSTGGPVSTPAIADGVVFAVGPRGDFLAVRVADGRLVWKKHLVQDFGAVEPHWGFTTSPLVTRDLVIVLAGGSKGRALIAFDRRTGSIVWQAGHDSVSYQSPIVATIGGVEQVIAGGDRLLFAIEPGTGRELWRHEHGGSGFYGRIINPVLVKDGLLLTSKPDQSVLLRTNGSSAPAEGWSSRELKLNYATPVVHANLVFGYSGAFLSAIDASTGELKWRSRPPGDGFPILVDDHLVVLTKQGQLAIAEANGSGFSSKASLQVFTGLVWTPPSFADGRIYARDSYEAIAAVDVVPAGRMTEADPAARSASGRIRASQFERWVSTVERAADAQSQVTAFLQTQKSLPVIEGDRYAHILYSGSGGDVLLRSDALGTGVEWPLHRIGTTDLYYASLELEPDARISYQFVRAAGDTFADPRNALKATSQNFAGEVSLLLMPRADRALPRPPERLRGRVVKHDFDSGAAADVHLKWGGPREIHVYLPPGYDESQARYPVAYVLYGNEMLQEGHLAAALEAQMGSTMAPAILVFIQSTNSYEYARTFRSAHRDMLVTRLVPWIDDQFRTRPTAEGRLLLGADEGGFAAVETGLRHPAVFGRIAAQSLFPLSDGDDELIALIEKTPRQPTRFYVDWGRYDPRRGTDRLDVPGFSARVRERLAARGFQVAGQPSSDGSTVLFWSARAVRAIKELLPLE